MFLFFRIERRNQDDNFQQHSSNQHNTEAIGCEPHPDGRRPNHLSFPLISNFVDFTLLGCGDCLVPVAGVEPARISIHSPHARGDAALGFDWTLFFISIHSPHARGDTGSNGNVWLQKISIHSPHARGDYTGVCLVIASIISIHSPQPPRTSAHGISIHSPHARGDYCRRAAYTPMTYFNPLPSYEGRRQQHNFAVALIGISIHSPHTRGDAIFLFSFLRHIIFQSIPLMRGRQAWVDSAAAQLGFQSTPLTRGETLVLKWIPPVFVGFQSTPLMRGETVALLV